MTVPFCDLRRCYHAHREEFDGAYLQVMEQSHFILGPQLEAFEDEFAAFCGTRFAVGVGNGLDALILILKARGIGPGDEVLVSAHTFVASWLAISLCGAKPVPIPPEENGLLLDPHRVEALITHATKAIMAVHLYGLPVDMTALNAIAAKYKIPVVEDAAQAHGALHKGRRCGNLGFAAGFSLYPGKNLGALGDGGVVTTSDEALFTALKLLRNYGSREKYVHEVVGQNSRLDEMQAAFLRVKLRHLDAWNERRREIAAQYHAAFKDLDFLRTPSALPGDVPVWHQYVIVTRHRDALQKHLGSLGIETLIHYPTANHKHKAYAEQDFSTYNLAGYERLVQCVLSLPIDPFLTQNEVARVIEGVLSFAPTPLAEKGGA